MTSLWRRSLSALRSIRGVQRAGYCKLLQPLAGQPTAGQPRAEQPTAGQPTAEQPTAEQPTAGQPTAEQPTAEQRSGGKEEIRQLMHRYNQMDYEALSSANFQELIRSDDDRLRIDEVLADYERAKASDAFPTPKTLNATNMENLLYLRGERFKQLKYIAYCAEVERARYRKDAIVTLRKAKKLLEQPKPKPAGKLTGIGYDEEGVPKYGLWKDTMFIRSQNRTLDAGQRRRLVESALFGPRLALDFSYQELMPPTDYTGVATQLHHIYMANQQHQMPFDLWLCNLPTGSRLRDRIATVAPGLFLPTSLCNVTGRSFLDVFPSEQLIYLSPDAEETIGEFDQNAVYILGGFVDRNDNRPESLRKANELGIRSMRLPIDQHVIWKEDCNRNLPCLSVFQMLLHMRLPYGRWKDAILQFASKRKQLDELETLSVFQKKMFDRLLSSDYAYVKSRQYVRNRGLTDRINKSNLLEMESASCSNHGSR